MKTLTMYEMNQVSGGESSVIDPSAWAAFKTLPNWEQALLMGAVMSVASGVALSTTESPEGFLTALGTIMAGVVQVAPKVHGYLRA